MRRMVFTFSFVVLSLSSSAFGASAAPTDTTTTTMPTVPILCPVNPDPTVTTVPIVGCVNPTVIATTTTSTTTTSLPSAVTTVPEGCALPPTAAAVFVGTVQQVDPVAAIFKVMQVRAGTLDGYMSTANTVEVRYGGDVKYLDTAATYLVGVAVNETTKKLASTVRDSAEIFGVPEAVGSNTQCPQFEAAARTLNIDGSSIESGLFANLFNKPLLLIATFLAPPILVVMGLVGLVWFRRGTKR